MRYTQKDIEEAKAFIRKRVEAEISMQNHLDEALLWAAKEIIDISYKYKIKASLFKFSANPQLKKEVDAILARLREMIYEYTEKLSVAVDKENRDDIVGFINEESYDHTLKERIGIYTNRYKYELEAFIGAALLFGMGARKLLSTVKSNLNAPYNNELFRRAVINKSELAATRIKSGGVIYGSGHSNCARTLLNTLTRNTVSSAWMNMYGSWAYNKGAIGFYSFRGSSYPCASCDSRVGYHPIEEYQGGWHLNCRCYFVFVYN